ncbi:uncharacterized protein LOC124789022, partial [Schistocerca piceifrons]|uniref:uncharacterized protein LOC124789022 n=1 Tax=Schistocerca piceifrons TaxID=274613 RepID=UPI001F5F4084
VMREAISPSRRLAVTLRFLATGESFKSLAFSHRIAQPTISNVIVDVCTAICETLKDQYLKAPSTEEEWNKIAKEFDELWQFPNCIGAMDGKHIAFAPPQTAGSTYFNYKKFHSVVLLAIVDARYRFSLIDIGCNGRVSDGGVYANSLISSALRENWLKTLCILHNYLIEEADTTYVTAADTENTDLCTINNGSWRGEKSLSSIPQQSGNRTSLCAREVREKFCEFFSTTGYVSWQWEAIKKYNF